MAAQDIYHQPIRFVDSLFGYLGLGEAVVEMPRIEASDSWAKASYDFKESHFPSFPGAGINRGNLFCSIRDGHFTLELYRENSAARYFVSATYTEASGNVRLLKQYGYYNLRGRWNHLAVEATVPLERLQGGDIIEQMIYGVREAAGLRPPNPEADTCLKFTVDHFAPPGWKDPKALNKSPKLAGSACLVAAGLLGLATAAYFLWRAGRSQSR